MKRIWVVIGMLSLLMLSMSLPGRSTSVESLQTVGEPGWLSFQAQPADTSNILIADYWGQRIMEVDEDGNILWQGYVPYPAEMDRLCNGNILMVGPRFVMELGKDGVLVWKTDVYLPVRDFKQFLPWPESELDLDKLFMVRIRTADSLPNGNILIGGDIGIVDCPDPTLIAEITKDGNIVWRRYLEPDKIPKSVKILPNDNILIGLSSGEVIEINNNGDIVWSYWAPSLVCDAERLLNGNTLITSSKSGCSAGQYCSSVLEVTPNGEMVWSYTKLGFTRSAERLPNGNTFIVENRCFICDYPYHGRLIEVDPNGDIVWELRKVYSGPDTTIVDTKIVEGEKPYEVNDIMPVAAVKIDIGPTPTPTPEEEGCFIATAAYGTSTAAELDTLRAFRDEVLLQNGLGSQLVTLYYEVSPPVADFISEHEPLRTLVRELLVEPVVWVVEATEALWRD